MEDKELDGYTEEEFDAMLGIIGVKGIYNLAVLNGWKTAAMTPQERMLVINQYRENAKIPAYFFKNGDAGKWGDYRGEYGGKHGDK